MKKTLMLVLALLMICPYVTLAQTRPHWLDISNKPLFPIDVTNYGVSTTNTLAENDAAFLLAIAAATTASKSLYIPAGKFSYSTALSIPHWMSITGEGGNSILNPVGCDGIILPAHTYPDPPRSFGTRVFMDFTLEGDTSDPAYRGIVFEGSDLLGPRLLNTNMVRVGFNGFDKGIYLKNAWFTTIQSCIFRCSTGVHIEGQNIKTDILGNTFVIPDLPGTSTLTDTHGVYYNSYMGYLEGERRPEDLQIIGNIIAGFDYGVKGNSALHVMIQNNDMDRTQNTGVSLSSMNGKTKVSENWIAIDGTSEDAAVGILANAVAVDNTGLSIESNYVLLTDPASATNAVGIASLGLHNATTIRDNDVVSFNYGIKVTNSTGDRIEGNRILGFYPGVSVAILGNFLFKFNITNNSTNGPMNMTVSESGVIDGNYCATGPQLVFIVSQTLAQKSIEIGQNWGAIPTTINDRTTMNKGVSSATIPLTTYGAIWDNYGCIPYVKNLAIDVPDAGFYSTIVGTDSLVITRTTTTATATINFSLGTKVYPE